MNWNNIDLNNSYERSREILDGYDSDTLLLEVSCNVADITKETIRAQAIESIKSKYNTAILILEANLDNYLNQALKERSI